MHMANKEGTVLLISPTGQNVWSDFKVGSLQEYFNSGFRLPTNEELIAAAEQLGKNLNDVAAEINING